MKSNNKPFFYCTKYFFLLFYFFFFVAFSIKCFLYFNLNHQDDFEANKNKARADEAMDVSQKKEKKKKTKCHNTFHSRVFAGPFVSLYLFQDLRFQR